MGRMSDAQRSAAYRVRRRATLPSETEWREATNALLLVLARHPQIAGLLDPVARLLLRLAKWHRISLHEQD